LIQQIEQLKQEKEEIKIQYLQEIQQLKGTNEELRNQQAEQIQRMQQEIEELKNPFLKGKMISFQTNHQGILQELDRIESNPITFSCSSYYCSYKPENLLQYGTSTLY
jgi:DNA repair exonuclease SbcCD ATPase subunit